jgi:hypothetical protein
LAAILDILDIELNRRIFGPNCPVLLNATVAYSWTKQIMKNKARRDDIEYLKYGLILSLCVIALGLNDLFLGCIGGQKINFHPDSTARRRHQQLEPQPESTKEPLAGSLA